MNSTSSAPAAFQDLLASMAEVDRLKSREEVLAIEADLPARVADVAARLKEVYARQGIAVSDETIAQGVEQFFSQRLLFREPPRTFGARVAVLWIHRERIFKAAAIVSSAALGIAAASYFLFIVPAREAKLRLLASTRQQIEEAGQKLQATGKVGALAFAHAGQEIAKAERGEADRETPKAAAVAETQLTSRRAMFEEKLKLAGEALAPFTPVERLKADAIPAALSTARQALDGISAASLTLDEAAGIASHLDSLRSERVSLELAWKRLDHTEVPAGLKSAAEQTYAQGLAIVTAFGPVAEVHQITARLNTLADAETRLRSLPAEIQAAAAEARTASRDPRADEQILANERAGLAAAQSGEMAVSEKSLAALRDITVQLSQVYTLRIVNRPREYTRFWRYPGRGATIKNYYIVVEAIAPDGGPAPVKIRSEEDGSTAIVSKWAERVDQAAYDAVGRDKQDDGILQNNAFGQKEKGRLAPNYLIGDKARGSDVEAGRIHHWEYRG